MTITRDNGSLLGTFFSSIERPCPVRDPVGAVLAEARGKAAPFMHVRLISKSDENAKAGYKKLFEEYAAKGEWPVQAVADIKNMIENIRDPNFDAAFKTFAGNKDFSVWRETIKVQGACNPPPVLGRLPRDMK